VAFKIKEEGEIRVERMYLSVQGKGKEGGGEKRKRERIRKRGTYKR